MMLPVAVTSRVHEIVEAFREPGASAAFTFCDRHSADDTAFRIVDGGEETLISFGELGERSRRVARVLRDLGVREGDRVASLIGKGADLPAIIVGVWRLGAVYVPLFTAFAGEAVRDRLAQAKVKAVVTDDAQVTKIPPGPWTVLLAGDSGASGTLPFWSLVDDADGWQEPAPPGPDVPLVHMFTSGTTGRPKTVVHSKLYAAGWQSYHEFGLGVTRGSVFWSAADPGWAYGLYTAIIAPMAAGSGSLLATGTFDPMATWAILDRYRVTHFAAAPTAYRAMKACDAQRPLPALRQLSSAGEPLSPDILEWTSSMGVPVHDHFGQTELGMPAGFPHHPSLDTGVQPSAMGRSLPGWSVTVLSLDADVPAQTGEIGRLAIDIPNSVFYTFTGYGVDRDDPSDRVDSTGNYYMTGDLASCDKAGILSFASRDDDIILMAGYRIGPFEVESTLLKHPVVREAAVVAAPDHARGEIIHAFIVLDGDRSQDQELVMELQDWVKEHYAAHAYPRRIDFVDHLPRTESGKVQRAALRAKAAQA